MMPNGIVGFLTQLQNEKSSNDIVYNLFHVQFNIYISFYEENSMKNGQLLPL